MAANDWYDPTKLAAAIASQKAGADGRTVLTGNSLLSALNPIAAPTWVPSGGSQWVYKDGTIANDSAHQDEYGNQEMPTAQPIPGYFISSNGTRLESPDGGQTFTDKYDNPTGNGNRDQANVTYRVVNGQAVPISASNMYSPGQWVANGQDLAKLAAVMATAGFGGAALAGAGAADGAAAGTGSFLGGDAGALGGGQGLFDAGAMTQSGLTTAQLGNAAIGSGLGNMGGIAADAAAGTAADTAAVDGGTNLFASGAMAPSYAGGAAAGGLTPAEMAMATSGAGGVASAAGGAGSGSGSLLGDIGSKVGNYLTSPGGISTVGGLLGAAAGAAGAGGGLNSATTTNQNTVDPRVAQYVYGANGSSGLLGNVNSLMNSQLASGGLNATQQQGLNMQMSALTDPAYGASLNQMRNVGTGLLGNTPAANPFTLGQAQLNARPQPMQAPQQAQPPGWQPMQTQLNQQRPQMTGLLGNPRPYGA